ncbi:MAG: TetR family transcriptional regulator [Planctomycetota bacterium]
MAGEGGEATERAGRILEAADALFCARGYDGVSVRDVAQAAGVNKALVFYHYESKQRLFERVLAGYYEAHARVLRDSLAAPDLGAGDGSPEDRRARLHELVSAYFDFMCDHHRYARLIQQEVARQGEHLELIRENLAQLFRASEQALAALLPTAGPLAPKHFFLSLSAMTINYFTYAPALGEVWGTDPLGEEARGERRAHLRWVVDALLDALEAE